MTNLDKFCANAHRYFESRQSSNYEPGQSGEAISTQIGKLNAELLRDNALYCKQNGSTGPPIPDLLRHGIGYVPPNDGDALRTIFIARLSHSTTISDVLSHVRGGLITDAKLLNTIGMTGSKTALVTFFNPQAAKSYHFFAQSHRITINGISPIISLLGTPTYPTPTSTLKLITQQNKTRCIAVHNFPAAVSALTVRRDLNLGDTKFNGLELLRMQENRVLELRFTAVRHAHQAGFVFAKLLHYRGCAVKTIPDPCAGPLEHLLQASAQPIAKSLKSDAEQQVSSKHTVLDEGFSVSKLLGLDAPSALPEAEEAPSGEPGAQEQAEVLEGGKGEPSHVG